MNQGEFFGQLVIGPAGAGKTTYCNLIQEMATTFKRNVLIVNLDPCAENMHYNCYMDIKDLITIDDVMEELNLGPNGALIYAMEYLIENIDWLDDLINDLGQDDYVLFDCPGQIELYTHLNIVQTITKQLQNRGFSLASVYMMDITFLSDHSKFISGCLASLSSQISLGLPHLNILTKCDLIEDKDKIEAYIEYSENLDDIQMNRKSIITEFDKKYQQLICSMREIVSDNNSSSLLPLNVKDEETIREILLQADHIIQYGENKETDDKAYDKMEEIINQQYE